MDVEEPSPLWLCPVCLSLLLGYSVWMSRDSCGAFGIERHVLSDGDEMELRVMGAEVASLV